MLDEARRLEDSAAALSNAADRVDDAVRRLVSRVESQVVYAGLGWKGPAATQFLHKTYDRASRLRRVRDRLRSLAEQMRREAWLIREETRQKAGT